jgi:hypothetical protein
LAAIAALLLLNLSYAFDGYGVKTSKLHLEVLAQTNDSVPSGGSGTDTGEKKTTMPVCSLFYYIRKGDTKKFRHTFTEETITDDICRPAWIPDGDDSGTKMVCDKGTTKICINSGCATSSGSST